MPMKVYQNPLRMTITFIIASLFCALLIFSFLFPIFLDWPWDFRQYLIIALWLVSSVVFYIISIKFNFYIIESKCIIVQRYKKTMYYYYNDIVYIDEEYSKKHKMVLFVTNKKDVRYMVFDRKQEIYKTLLNKCHNLLTYEQLIAKYGEIKNLRKPKKIINSNN